MIRETFVPGSTKDASARENLPRAGKRQLSICVNASTLPEVLFLKDLIGVYLNSTLNVKVRQAGYETWRNKITPMLDLEKMVDQQTGLTFSPQKLEIALRDVYETISTDGMSKIKPSGRPSGQKAMANQHAEHRFLVFKDADTWMKYNDEFGNSNPFDVMIGHISNMSRDIAFMERLGPNNGNQKLYKRYFT